MVWFPDFGLGPVPVPRRGQRPSKTWRQQLADEAEFRRRLQEMADTPREPKKPKPPNWFQRLLKRIFGGGDS